LLLFYSLMFRMLANETAHVDVKRKTAKKSLAERLVANQELAPVSAFYF